MFPLLFARKWWEPWSLCSEYWVLSQLSHSLLSPSSRGSLVPLHFLPFSSVQFSHSVTSDSLWPNRLQHTRLPCPSPTPRVCSNSCPLSQWGQQTISFSVIPFSSCLQSFPASGSFQMSQFFTSGDQSIGVSASTPVLPMNIQNWFPLGLTYLISLQSRRLSRVFSSTTVWRHQFFGTQPFFFFGPVLISVHNYWKNHSLH